MNAPPLKKEVLQIEKQHVKVKDEARLELGFAGLQHSDAEIQRWGLVMSWSKPLAPRVGPAGSR